MTNLNLAVTELHKKGYSFSEIAQELNISKSKAHRIFHKAGNVTENEPTVEHHVPKPSQVVEKQPETTKNSKKYNAESLKLQVKLRKMELQHEAEMKRLDMEEQEKKRDFELTKDAINLENEKLKNRIEDFRQKISDLEKIDNEYEDEIEEEEYEYEKNIEAETFEEEYIPELDIVLKDEIKEFLSNIIETEKHYEEELEDLVSNVSDLTNEIIEQAEIESVDTVFFQEFGLMKDVGKAIKDYQDNFDSYRSFFGSTVKIEFNNILYSKIQEYVGMNSDE